MTTLEEIDVSRTPFLPRSSAEIGDFPLRLFIRASGEARYEAHVNALGDEPEIGRYRHEFSRECLAHLDGIIGALPLERLAADLQQAAGATAAFVQLRILARGREVSLLFIPFIQREQLLQSLVSESDALARELLAHPEWTLRAETFDMRREGPRVTLTVRLTNRGTSAIGLRALSAAMSPGGEGPFDGWFSGPDADGAPRQSESTIESVELLTPAVRTQHAVELRPEHPLDVRLRVRLPNERGGSLYLGYSNRQARVDELEMAVGYVSMRAVRVPDAVP